MNHKILILLCVISGNLAAQSVSETKTVFGNGKPHLGYFVTPFSQFGKIAGSTAILPGIGAGILLNNSFTFGVTYKFIATQNTPAGEADNRLYLDQFYAGIKGEYSIFPEKTVHLNFLLEAGIGHTELDLKDSYENNQLNIPMNDASFGFVEPGLAVEINLWKYLKLDLGAGYRITSDISFRSLTEKDIRGFTCFGGIKIGLF